jgi:Tripartite tricarboxylate transporter family receptor
MLTRPHTLPTGFLAPCLPTKTDKLPSGSQWLHEIKHDGFRIIARKDGPRVRLYSRPGNDLTAWNVTLYDHLGFNFIRDIAPVASIYRGPAVLVVHPSFPAKSVPALIAYAKANPGKINMASGGVGSAAHMSALLRILIGHLPRSETCQQRSLPPFAER